MASVVGPFVITSLMYPTLTSISETLGMLFIKRSEQEMLRDFSNLTLCGAGSGERWKNTFAV
jgi:hypothetical protein